MKIEVRNVKEAKFASEETMCFEATVVIDGKVVGKARNDGRGGCNMYSTRELETALREYAASLGPMMDGGKPLMSSKDEPLMHSADSALGEVIDEHLSRKEMVRTLKNYVVVLKADRAIYKSKKLTKGQDPLAAARTQVGKPGVDAILNLLPEDEAFRIWRGTYAGIPGVGLMAVPVDPAREGA